MSKKCAYPDEKLRYNRYHLCLHMRLFSAFSYYSCYSSVLQVKLKEKRGIVTNKTDDKTRKDTKTCIIVIRMASEL